MIRKDSETRRQSSSRPPVANLPPLAARGANYFGIATRTNPASYFFMNRLLCAAALAIASLLTLTGCATDEDPFVVHPAGTVDSDASVAGAATPPPESSSAGWKW